MRYRAIISSIVVLGVFLLVFSSALADPGLGTIRLSPPMTPTPLARPNARRIASGPWSSWTSASNPGTTSNLYAVATSGTGIWVAVGPSGTAIRSTDDGNTWQTVNTRVSSAFNLNAVAFSSPNQVWAGGDAGTLASSSDGGATWSSKVVSDTNGQPLFIYGIAFTSPTVGYLAGKEEVQPAGDFLGEIFQTTDSGQTWHVMTLPVNTGIWNAIAFNASGSVGLAVSSDNQIIQLTGGTWQNTNYAGRLGTVIPFSVAFAPDGTTAEVVGSSDTFVQSPDSGMNWSPATPPAGGDPSVVYYGVAFVPTSTGLGAAVGSDTGSAQLGQVIAESNDVGASWALAFSSNDVSTHTTLDGVACSVTTCIAVGDQGSNVLRATTGLTPPPTNTPTVTPTLTPTVPSGSTPTPTSTRIPGMAPKAFLPDVPNQASSQ